MTHIRNPGILVDQQVKLKAGNRPFASVCPIQAKGYSCFVNIYTPEGNTQRSCWKERSSLVGRQQELARVVSKAETIIKQNDSSSGIVYLEGPYGIGKSSLLSHAAQAIETMGKDSPGGIVAFRHVCCDEDSFRPFRYDVNARDLF
jgi:hypothetical protein